MHRQRRAGSCVIASGQTQSKNGRTKSVEEVAPDAMVRARMHSFSAISDRLICFVSSMRAFECRFESAARSDPAKSITYLQSFEREREREIYQSPACIYKANSIKHVQPPLRRRDLALTAGCNRRTRLPDCDDSYAMRP